MKRTLAALALALLSLGPGPLPGGSGFTRAVEQATKALENGELERAKIAIDRALERDPNALIVWELTERWAEKADDKDERVYALHRQLAISRAQKKDKAALDAIRARLEPLDPLAAEFVALRTKYFERLTKLAEGYEKLKRPHSAIRAYKQALALDPDRTDVVATIERIASAPDPTLAEDARPKDLLEGVSAEWIAEHDAKHLEWADRATLEKPNYRTQTDAGYEVLVRTAEAMEQMNAFYRVFFRYGAEGDKRSPSRIDVNIFKKREEYTQDPKDWSGGHYTGSAVETYIGPGGFEAMTRVLFHEAAHQFVSLATAADGWLNEGMASFFEGTRILANGTVVMNLPANHYLVSLTDRIRKGWMANENDGIDPNEATKEPATAPTFRIVLEGKYEWAPPWYAPAWGFVFFCYNYQDPADGRFVYRKAFWDFVAASGGKMGDSAITTFEELVLAQPEPITEGVTSTLKLAKTVDEVNEVWKDYLFRLRDQQTGADKNAPPYLKWAQLAMKRGALDDAAESFEKALQTAPNDLEVLAEFAGFLGGRKQDDRAAKLLARALSVLETSEPVDQKRVAEFEARMGKVDPSYQRLDEVRSKLVEDAGKLIDKYLAAQMNLQAMDIALHLGSELQEPSLFAGYEKAVRAEGRSPAVWRLAYNEEDLRGWSAGLETIFKAAGETLESKFGTYSPAQNDFSILTLDQLTSGDYSLECELEAVNKQVNFAGLVFGRKSDLDCHALILYPPAPGTNGFVNLVTFYGGSSADTWRHNPVQHPDDVAGGEAQSRSSVWYKVRIDVTGRLVDIWVNGEYQATHEFASLDVLRGTFGLITGRGEAKFRNVRFLARHPRDPSAAIERKLILEEKSGGGEAVNGSWLGQVPPFPAAKRWLQEPRTSWAEANGHPQLLVMWSIDQNNVIPIDGYLRDLAAKHAAVGLRVVNVLAFWDEDASEAYLASHAFPGSLALDTPTQEERNIGVTFTQFDLARFHMPRFLLLDIDGKVAWEGDPGFAKGAAWGGEESLLDVPLRELVAKRRLAEFGAWRTGWPAARAALARGELAAAAPALKAAADFDPKVSSEVAEALGIVAALEGALGGLDELGKELAAAGREPALEVLLEWSVALGKPAKKSKGLTALLKNPSLAAWKRAPGMLKPALTKAAKDPAALEAALGKVAELPGAFPAELAAAARAEIADLAAVKALVDESPALPARWLASEHFGW
jgi:Tfp pilus assembly protein PilF